MIAFSVASYFDIDTSNYSFSYLSHWGKDEFVENKSESLSEVRKTATEFVSVIE